MSNGPMAFESSIVATRIGPIFDPKFLHMISDDVIKEIVLVQLQAQISAMQAEIKAVEKIAEVVKGAKLG